MILDNFMVVSKTRIYQIQNVLKSMLFFSAHIFTQIIIFNEKNSIWTPLCNILAYEFSSCVHTVFQVNGRVW